MTVKEDEEEETKETKPKLLMKPKEDNGTKILLNFIEKFTNPLTSLEEKAKMVINPIPKEIPVL